MARTTKKTRTGAGRRAKRTVRRRTPREVQADLFDRLQTPARTTAPAQASEEQPRRRTAPRTGAAASAGRKARKTRTSRKAKASRTAKKVKAPKAKPGIRMALGRGWRLSSNGGRTAFSGTLLHIHNAGKTRIALFSILKPR